MELDPSIKHVLLRPAMYVGDGPEASIALAWFINGFIAARQGFGWNSLFCRCPCVPDPTLSLKENAARFLKQLESDHNELIVEAALRKQGRVFSVPKPGRHDKVIQEACDTLKIDYIGEHEQGFTTSDGRFVDREEAARIAYDAGQVSIKLNQLFSEDVW